MGVLAKASADEIAQVWSRLATPPDYEVLRPAACGLVMVRGRIGGDGRPFNLGEMTVTRCSVRLASGGVGHAWVAGRSRSHAERAAVLDALLQDADRGADVHSAVRELQCAQTDRRDKAGRKAAATRVEFFTMVRGEDQAP